MRQGRGLTFVNRDARPRRSIHTITACKAPCNRTTGIAYPLADGQVDFDSGKLGFGPRGFTAAANRDTWTTPKRLKAGTYTYFCRVHPFMRGAFEVKRRCGGRDRGWRERAGRSMRSSWTTPGGCGRHYAMLG